MNQIFEKYGKVITAVIGIIIAVGMLVTAGAAVSAALNKGTEKLTKSAEEDWLVNDTYESEGTGTISLGSAEYSDLNNQIAILQEKIENVNSFDIDKVYPVGSLYISVSSSNPGDLFGGKWEKLDGGRMLINSNGTYPLGTTGGSASTTLAANQIPSLSITGKTTQSANDAVGTTGTGVMQGTSRVVNQAGEKYESNHLTGYSASSFSEMNWSTKAPGMNHAHYVYLSSALPVSASYTNSSQKAVNTISPYLSVNMWKRVG